MAQNHVFPPTLSLFSFIPASSVQQIGLQGQGSVLRFSVDGVAEGEIHSGSAQEGSERLNSRFVVNVTIEGDGDLNMCYLSGDMYKGVQHERKNESPRIMRGHGGYAAREQ